ncbi:MAG TPA: hypothetical protein VML75_20175 [Kofleriaceae bacterium]|nr:hypothetical protein [Kofleriaceae bacterium]
MVPVSSVGAAALLACAIGLTSMSGCKKRASYDTDTPESAIAAFAGAVNAGNIPEDVGRLVLSELEQRKWKLRCRTRGCKKATFKVVERGNVGEYRALLYVDYVVEGDHGARVIEGKRAPIRLEREGGRWFIAQFGDELAAPSDAGMAEPAPPAGDGGTDSASGRDAE